MSWRLPIALFCAIGISAQQQTPSPEQVDAIFAAYASSATPGCQVGVLRQGEFVYTKAFGMADLEHRVPLTTASPTNVGSLAKQFTAAVVARLARDGKLSLDDSVRKYVPELPAYADQVTLRHLIHHTSGLRDFLGLVAIAGEPDDFHTSESEFLELMARQKALNFEPGSRFLYSNSGYVMLSIVVRRVTGKSLREAADGFIFSPLGMKQTRFDDRPTELIRDRALAYAARGRDYVLNTNASVGVVGDGALYTTVEDLRHWDRYLSSEPAQELFVGGKLKDGTTVPYAFGLTVNSYYGHQLIAHGGGFKGYRASFWKFPAEQLTAISLCNTGVDPTPLNERVSALYLGVKAAAAPAPQQNAATAREKVTIPQEDLSRYAGVYYSEDLDAEYEVRVLEGKLGFRCKHSIFEAEPEGNHRFRFSSYSFRFELDDKGHATGYVMNALRVFNLPFTRITKR